METENMVQELDIPTGVSVTFEDTTAIIKGPKGEVKKTLFNPTIRVAVSGNSVCFYCGKKYTKKEKKLINTYAARFKRFFQGVQSGHIYKLKICSGHFPMSVSVKGAVFEVKNFIGENNPRKLNIKQGAHIKINGDEIVVEGIDIDVVAQTAADIESLTRRSGFDKRVFMDGIWITHKNAEAGE